MTMVRGWKLVAMAGGAALGLAIDGAQAFHPGETHSGDVPQGPEWIACENPGWNGIEIAIGVGGMVHCEEIIDIGGSDGDNGETSDGGQESSGGDGGVVVQ
jgi:hypothetical protein